MVMPAMSTLPSLSCSSPHVVTPLPLLDLVIFLASMLCVKIGRRSQFCSRLHFMQEGRHIRVAHKAYSKGFNTMIDMLQKSSVNILLRSFITLQNARTHHRLEMSDCRCNRTRLYRYIA